MSSVLIKRVLLSMAFGMLCGIWLAPVVGLFLSCVVVVAFGLFVPQRIWPTKEEK